MYNNILSILFFSFFLQTVSVHAQVPDFPTQNSILDDRIRTVQMYLSSAQLSLPIVEIKSTENTLICSFDHLSTDIKDYVYTIVHCNSNWLPSELDKLEYIDGFAEDRIRQYNYSVNTLKPYVHYTLTLPNSNMRWTKSGNYLLLIYDNDADKELVLVRRFCVLESAWAWAINTKFVRPADPAKFDTHQEMDISLLHRNQRIQNPKNDIKIFILQNGQWAGAIGPIQPLFSRLDEEVFDFQDSIVFPGGKEWRFFDIRSLDYRGQNVQEIERYQNNIEVLLLADENRARQNYYYQGDINGRFSIENTNYRQTLDQCEYATVRFTLKAPQPIYESDVYLFGELTDWQLKPEFKMAYFEKGGLYYVDYLLKQGFYNYEYRVVNQLTGEVDEDGVEGNSYQARNVYVIMAYYRPFGARYDRLMAVSSASTFTD